jgi:hypothetical protein
MFFRILILTSLVFTVARPVPAASIFDQLSESNNGEVLAVTLTLQIDSLHIKRASIQPATLSYSGADGVLQSWSVKVSPRGKYRLHKCEHAPLKLDFRKKDLRAANLADHDKYKLVTSCFHGTSANRLVQKEYLAYRAYQLFTPVSYRVRLLEVTYRDVNGNNPDRTAAAFLIENTKELAERQITQPVDKSLGLPAGDFDPTAEATHALFQYLIGNTDWSTTLAQNMKTLVRPDGAYLPVGYDFDFSGWVKTPYSVPRAQLGQRTVSQRVYLGFHQPDDVLSTVVQTFLDKKEALHQLIEEGPLARPDRRYLLRYTQTFYAELEDLQQHDIMMLYQNLRGREGYLIPAGAMPSDFAVMKE